MVFLFAAQKFNFVVVNLFISEAKVNWCFICDTRVLFQLKPHRSFCRHGIPSEALRKLQVILLNSYSDNSFVQHQSSNNLLRNSLSAVVP